jgi:hypothetical protein
MAGKKTKKPQQPQKKKHPPERLRALMCSAWKYPRGNTPVSVPTPDPAKRPLALLLPTPAPAARAVSARHGFVPPLGGRPRLCAASRFSAF